ncbi:MAG: ribonuclease D [Alphaproteobacteria bacterium]|nr:ribonuclease D [Alphaproteobacteria bacterium]
MDNTSRLITTTDELERALNILCEFNVIAIDTEFIRESTYYPQLCLIQLAAGDHYFAVDPQSDMIELTALFEMMTNKDILKVFHAGRQDIEIFVHLTGNIPDPIFDTQIAAMVVGLGDQAGYDKLVQHYLNIELDKSSRFTDWSARPLSERQLEYALDDVIHLAKIYPIIHDELYRSNRLEWLDDDISALTQMSVYKPNPDDAWKRLKVRSHKPDFLNRLKFLASWREQRAIEKNMPKNRIIRDETLIDIAGTNPKNVAKFQFIRGFPGGSTGKLVPEILKTLAEAEKSPRESWPKIRNDYRRDKAPAATLELLRVLLKHITEAENIAPKLLASAEELEALARDDNADIKLLKGWRRELFGNIALQLKSGEIALTLRNNKLELIYPEKD